MITEELVELTHWILDKKTEKQDLEVKAANGGCPKRLYDTLSSFSNQDGGGIIFFGIDETQDFRLVGVYELQDLLDLSTDLQTQYFFPLIILPL